MSREYEEEYKKQRTVFTAEELRREPLLPGFFDNGPAHFGPHLLYGENYLNPVYALALVIKTSRGYRMFTGVRSPNEERQPNVGSALTVRETPEVTRKTMEAYSDYRIPILGKDRRDIQNEGYHITELDPANPMLVADYKPAPLQMDSKQPGLSYLKHTYFSFARKMIDHPDPANEGQREIYRMMEDATYWLGPTIIGVSEVGEEHIPEKTLYEANIMSTIVAALDLSDQTPEQILQAFSPFTEHYSHFDLAHIDLFDHAVKNNVIDYIAPRFKDREREGYGMLYINACARGLCLRAAAVALARHMVHIRKVFGDEPEDTKKIYRPPIQLNKFTR